jgi:hypothetical protein
MAPVQERLNSVCLALLSLTEISAPVALRNFNATGAQGVVVSDGPNNDIFNSNAPRFASREQLARLHH